jgi:hypothetical protein
MDKVKTKLGALARVEERKQSIDKDRETIPALPSELRVKEPTGYKFLDEYVAHSRKWSPRSPAGMHEATALWVLSAASAGRVRYYDGEERKTSLYQLVVAESTTHAKSTCASIGKKLLEKAGLKRVLIGKATPQSYFDQCLEKVPPDYAELPEAKKEQVKEKLQSIAQRAWYADEFGSWAVGMLNPNSVAYGFLEMLLEVYDGPTEYSQSTRTYGTQAMEEPTLALLGSTTYAHLEKIAGTGSPLWRDGLMARMAVITPSPSEPMSNARWPEGEQRYSPVLLKTLRDYDQKLGRDAIQVVPRILEGQQERKKPTGYDVVRQPAQKYYVDISPEAREASYAYDDFIRGLCYTPFQVPRDLHPSYGRLRDRALRIAVLLASVEGSAQPVVTLRDWHKAQAIVERQRYSLHHAYDVLTGKASKWQEETLGEEVYNFIAAHGPIRQRDITRHFQKRPEFKSTERARREMEAICKEYNIASRTVIRGGIVYAIREEELASFAVAAKGTKG